MKNDHEKELDVRTVYFVIALSLMFLFDLASCTRNDTQDIEIEKLKVWDQAVTQTRRWE